MTTTQRNSKFYVVGGPVRPDQACYVLRDADTSFYARLSEQDYSYVLAPDQSGKTSLMAHTALRLRDDGVRVATVDLAQISGRDTVDDVGRWYYSIAYRIMRELRIRSDMQTWWQERSGLTNMQRLREFFLEVVLENSDDRIVIFIDRVEAVVGRPFARELLTAIRACHDARATEPEYQRLTFAMLGSAAIGQLVPGGTDSPFDVSSEIRLHDFSASELRGLSVGLGCDQTTAGQVSDRIFHWTSGQPYLSQKILRTLARRPENSLTAATVDEVVGSLFLSADGPRPDAHLNAIGKQLTQESPGRVARLNLYGRIRNGSRVKADLGLDLHRNFYRLGIVTIDEDGFFKIRNEIYEQAFTTQWVNKNLPFGWKGLATAALVATVFLIIPLWYTQFLPRSYVETLSDPNQDYVTALDSYKRLGFLPGFGAKADRLFADYLVLQSRRARRLVEVERFSDRLTEIPGRESLSDALLAEFWDRRATISMHRGHRDTALLFAARAVSEPTAERRQLVAELLGTDYGKLQGTIRTAVPLTALQFDVESGLITSLDEQHRVEVWSVAEGVPRRIQRLELLAEEILPLQRRLTFEGAESGRRLVLDIDTDHPRPTDIVVDLRAPSGRQVQLTLSAGEGGASGGLKFDSQRDAQLSGLLEENINGTWTAYFTDALQGVSGNLLDWKIRIDGVAAVSPGGLDPEPAPIPESGVTREASSALAPGGRRALSWPRDPAIRGDILVWNVAGGEVLARIPRPANIVDARFALQQSAVFITTANAVEIWSVDRAEMLIKIPIEPSLPPVLSENGRFLVVDSLLGDLENALAVWDLQELAEVGRLVTGALATVVATDPAGRYLAVSDGDSLVRLWSVRDGKLVAEYEHGAKPMSVRFDTDGQWLMTEDAAHEFRLWSLDEYGKASLTRRASSALSANISDNAMLLGSLDRGFEIVSLPSGDVIGESFQHGIPIPRKADEWFVAPVWLSAERGFAVTYDGREAIKVWSLPQLALEGAPTAGGVRGGRNQIALSRDGRQIAIATNAGDVRILPIVDQALLLGVSSNDPGFIGHLDTVTSTAFDASGTLVASGSFDGSIRVWETASGAPRNFFSSHADGAVHDLIFSPDGEQVISATRRSVMVFDASNGESLAQMPIQAEEPHLAVSSNGQHIYIAGDRDGLTRWLWKSEISEALIGPTAKIRKVAVSADETLIVTANRLRQIQIWDALSMTPRDQHVRTAAAVDYLSIDPGGTRIFVQAGTWLHGLEVTVAGLRNQYTRLLEDAPVAVSPYEFGTKVRVLSRPDMSRPVLQEIELSRPWPEPPGESLEQVVPGVETSLGLTLNDWGEPQPLQQF
jgi:WD40 repeat protein